jgi:hypothetical protein
VLPSWIRSSIGIWARPYLRAIETTSRRLAVMNVSMAFWPSSASHSSSSRLARIGAPPLARAIRPVSRQCWAIRPASIVLASSTSVAASSSGLRAISSRYSPTLSLPSISRAPAVLVRVAMVQPPSLRLLQRSGRPLDSQIGFGALAGNDG